VACVKAGGGHFEHRFCLSQPHLAAQTSLVYGKSSEIKPQLPLNVSEKLFAARGRPYRLISGNDRNAQRQDVYRFCAIEAIAFVPLADGRVDKVLLHFRLQPVAG